MLVKLKSARKCGGVLLHLCRFLNFQLSLFIGTVPTLETDFRVTGFKSSSSSCESWLTLCDPGYDGVPLLSIQCRLICNV